MISDAKGGKREGILCILHNQIAWDANGSAHDWPLEYTCYDSLAPFQLFLVLGTVTYHIHVMSYSFAINSKHISRLFICLISFQVSTSRPDNIIKRFWSSFVYRFALILKEILFYVHNFWQERFSEEIMLLQKLFGSPTWVWHCSTMSINFTQWYEVAKSSKHAHF